ncbi:DUF4360 domain-containing protein [Pilimelia columellifera]|uniref:DUF4360 domain-containing protein n=1 Tax=Pilimelia columellifera subsp. columellifera TaxID=706583 RepID=A0ABP6AHW7_9ACTN
MRITRTTTIMAITAATALTATALTVSANAAVNDVAAGAGSAATADGAATSTTTNATAAVVPPGAVTIALKAAGGTGCPRGTTKARVNAAKTTIYLRYSKYTAQVGPKAPSADIRRFCQLVVAVKAPQGFSYAVTTVTHYGHGKLASDTKGYLQSALYFAGTGGGQSTESRVTLRSSKFTAKRSIADAKLVWSRCGEQQDLNIKSGLRIAKGASAKRTRSYLTIDTSKVTESTSFNIRWKKC